MDTRIESNGGLHQVARRGEYVRRRVDRSSEWSGGTRSGRVEFVRAHSVSYESVSQSVSRQSMEGAVLFCATPLFDCLAFCTLHLLDCCGTVCGTVRLWDCSFVGLLCRSRGSASCSAGGCTRAPRATATSTAVGTRPSSGAATLPWSRRSSSRELRSCLLAFCYSLERFLDAESLLRMCTHQMNG